GFTGRNCRAFVIYSRNCRACGDRRRCRRCRRSEGRADPRQDGPARGLRQADRDRPAHGVRIRHQGQHDGRRPQDRHHHQGRPEQARPFQVGAGRSLSGRQGGHRDRYVVVRGGAGRPAGRRGKQEDPDRRARGRRPDHRRQ
ncbi:hypothetical protein KXW38_001840, partial [Aspergillus fumigatus]